MRSSDLLPTPPSSRRSALKDLLASSTVYEKAGAVIPKDLLQFGLFGSALVIATGCLALILPSPASISQGDFFLVLGSTAAGLDSVLHDLAIPAIVSGALLLGLDIYLMHVPTSEQWRWAVIGQATVGGAGGGLGVVFLALVILNIALWIAIFACILTGIGALLAGLASG
jgi:hypothetical protein